MIQKCGQKDAKVGFFESFMGRFEMEWIRVSDLPSVYPIKPAYAYELVKQFRAESDDWIKDGRASLVKKRSFEEWWKEKSLRRQSVNQQQGR